MGLLHRCGFGRERDPINEAEELGLAALPLLEERQDHVGLAQMWFALAFGVYNYADRYEQIVHAAEMARTYETLAGQPHHRSDGLRAMALAHGPRPVDEVLGTLDALDSSVRVDLARADLLAMSDRIDDARALLQATDGPRSGVGTGCAARSRRN